MNLLGEGMRFRRFVILWFILVLLGTLIYPPIYRAYAYYFDKLSMPEITVLFNLVTQPFLGVSFIFLAAFPAIMFRVCCRFLFSRSQLSCEVKLQEMQAVFSGIGFGAFFLIFAFGLNLPQYYNRALVILCAMLGLCILLVVYKHQRENLLRR